jgi:hypothetical protein
MEVDHGGDKQMTGRKNGTRFGVTAAGAPHGTMEI